MSLNPANIYAAEYNKPELSDRIIVLDVLPSPLSKPLARVTEQSETTRSEKGIEKLKKATDCSITEDEEADAIGESPSAVESGTSYIRNRPRRRRDTSYLAGVKRKKLSTTGSNDSTSDLEASRQHKFFVHSSWLAVHSSYFRSLFYSGMKESSAEEVHLKIPESELKAHLVLLEAIYKPDILQSISLDDALAILELADKYNVVILFQNVVEVLKGKMITLSACEKVHTIINIKQKMVGVEALEKEILSFLTTRFSPLDRMWKCSDYDKMSLPLLKRLLSSSDLLVQSENTVFHALMHWLDVNDFDQSSDDPSSPLLGVVRFQLLTTDYLINVVQHHPIATKMTNFPHQYLQGINFKALTPEMRRSLNRDSIPVSRREPERDITQYTWNISKSCLGKLIDSGKISSEPLWCCGYRFRMLFKRNPSSTDEDPCYFNAYVVLEVMELETNSVLPLIWSVSLSTMCVTRKQSLRRQCTFSANGGIGGAKRSCIEVSFYDELNTSGSFKFDGSLSISLVIKPK